MRTEIRMGDLYPDAYLAYPRTPLNIPDDENPKMRTMILAVASYILCVLPLFPRCVSAAEQTPPPKNLPHPGELFMVDGRPAFLMLPEESKRRPDQPWIMYAPTLPPYPDAAEKWMHEQFLSAGIAVAGIDVGEAYGSQKGNAGLSALYDHLTEKRGFTKKVLLLGRSRGGLWMTSWAAANPDKVAAFAGIYPVFDLRSYPGLQRASTSYGMTPEELEGRIDEFNPIAKVGKLAQAKIPVFIIHGDSDKVVPLEPNSLAFQKRYELEKAEDLIELVIAPDQGHNMWEGFFRCDELVDFLKQHAPPTR